VHVVSSYWLFSAVEISYWAPPYRNSVSEPSPCRVLVRACSDSDLPKSDKLTVFTTLPRHKHCQFIWLRRVVRVRSNSD